MNKYQILGSLAVAIAAHGTPAAFAAGKVDPDTLRLRKALAGPCAEKFGKFMADYSAAIPPKTLQGNASELVQCERDQGVQNIPGGLLEIAKRPETPASAGTPETPKP